ncbi:MAG: hypothetical protein EOS27_12180 [Mesorhizobium sp.]|nr:MAG: hypothetical protein EOS27_12180 [Mesorhizobium sp.]
MMLGQWLNQLAGIPIIDLFALFAPKWAAFGHRIIIELRWQGRRPSKPMVTGSNPVGIAKYFHVRSGHISYGLYRRHR